MIDFNFITKRNIKSQILNWLQILDLPYRSILTGASEYGVNILFNIRAHQPDINEILLYIYTKDPYVYIYIYPYIY